MNKNEYREKMLEHLESISETLMDIRDYSTFADTPADDPSKEKISFLNDIDTDKISEAFKLFGGLLKK